MSASVTALYGPTGDRPAAATRVDAMPRDEGYGGNLDEQHARLLRWYEEAEMTSLDARDLSMRDRAYVDGDQWTHDERVALNKRGQPEITINYCRRKISLLCGMERRARTDPKAFPRDPTEEERADAATQALRYVADNSDFQIARSAVYENMLVEGFGGVEIGLSDDGKGGADVTITQIGWERIWFDPHSRAPDFSDARYTGLVIWMDRDQLEELYPDAGDVTADSFSHYSGSYDDRPREMVAWTDTKRQRCRVVQAHWLEQGTWWSATFSRAGFLANPQRSPFKDRRGKSACALLLQAAYIDQNNRRYGVVRDLISEQDEINKRRSKALHLLSVRSVIAEKGAVEDVDKARREVARPDGYVEITPGLKFEVADGAQLAEGQFKLLQHATQEMQQSGPNASLSGTNPQELSGRAILANQAGGMAQNEPLADALRMWSRRVYEMCWMALREYWTAGKWVRVTDDLGSTRWVGINRPVTVQDALAAMPEQQRMVAMQRMQPPLQPGDPRLTQVIGIQNDVTDLDVDITIDEGQDVPTMQAENFQTLIQLASMQPGLIPGEVLIAASGLRNKDQLLAMMKQKQEAQAGAQQQAAQLAGQHAQAQVTKLQGDAAAQFALAKERNINAIHTVAQTHQLHTDINAPPDQPSDPGANAGMGPGVNPLMASHASGGLVTRTAPAEPTWRGSLPGSYVGPDGQVHTMSIDPSFKSYSADPATADAMRLDYGGPNVSPWAPGSTFAPVQHAVGGPVATMTGPNPPGPDDGFITAKPGEYVMQQAAVARYGPQLMDALNSGAIDPKMLETAAAHAAADLRGKQAKAALDEAKAVQTRHAAVGQIADTHNQMVTTNRLARTPIPQPQAPGVPSP